MILSAIYLDLDGVLVDFVAGVLRAFDLSPALVCDVPGWDAIPATISKHLGETVTDADMWRRIEGASFWAGLTWTEHGRELYEACASTGLPVVFMSSPCNDPYSAAGKLQWLAREIPGGARRYALSPCKHHMAHRGALLVDDSGRNCAKFREHGGKAFLWPAPWNEYACMPSGVALERLRKTLVLASRDVLRGAA